MKRQISFYAIIAVFCFISKGFAQFGGSPSWNNPGTQLPAGITHKTYHSDLMNVDIGYNIYLPPNYNSSTDRYPVIYSLHGMGGNENGNCSNMGGVLQNGINANDFPPVIMVFVNGRSNTFYSDSKDGTVKCESTIMNELIPHIDSNYRTKADRTQRAIEGISMGGFGALMLGFKHPDVFASIATYDAALVTYDTLRDQQFDRTIPSAIFGNDKDYFNNNSYPFTFAKKNADTIKSLGIKVRMITGSNDLQMGPLYYYNLAMKDTLTKLGISLDFKVIQGGTHGQGMNATTGKENMIFHTTNFAITSIKTTRHSFLQSNFLQNRSVKFSTQSSFRMPTGRNNSVNGLRLYNLSGKNLGKINSSGSDFLTSKQVKERFGSGMYMIKMVK